MSAPSKSAPPKDPYVELAEKIFIALASRVYGTLAGTDSRKPDPKALAAYSFKLAEAFEQATKETDRQMAVNEAADKAAVRLADVDMSDVFESSKKS
jgi:hypothetical protein